MRSVKALFDYFMAEVTLTNPEKDKNELIPTVPVPEVPPQEEAPQTNSLDQLFHPDIINKPEAPVTPEVTTPVEPSPEDLFPAAPEAIITPEVEQGPSPEDAEITNRLNALDELSEKIEADYEEFANTDATIGSNFTFEPPHVIDEQADIFNYNEPSPSAISKEGFEFDQSKRLPSYAQRELDAVLEDYKKTGVLKQSDNPVVNNFAQLSIFAPPNRDLPMSVHPTQAADYVNEFPMPTFSVPLSKSALLGIPSVLFASLLVEGAEKNPEAFAELKQLQVAKDAVLEEYQAMAQPIAQADAALRAVCEAVAKIRVETDFQNKKQKMLNKLKALLNQDTSKKVKADALSALQKLEVDMKRIEDLQSKHRFSYNMAKQQRDVLVKSRDMKAQEFATKLGQFISKYQSDSTASSAVKQVKHIYRQITASGFGTSSAASLKRGRGILTQNEKLVKQIGEEVEYKGRKYSLGVFAGLSLSPSTACGVGDLCSSSTACVASCLGLKSGQNAGHDYTDFGHMTKMAKARKTFMLVNDFDGFKSMLEDEISNYSKLYKGKEALFGVRLNTLSDLNWEDMSSALEKKDNKLSFAGGQREKSIIRKFPDVNFYDYTKDPERYIDFLTGQSYNSPLKQEHAGNPNQRWPENYHLTMSMSEVHLPMALLALEMGGNVATSFDTPAAKNNEKAKTSYSLPPNLFGYAVVNGDKYDARFADKEVFGKDPRIKKEIDAKRGLIVGLRLKGAEPKREFYTKKLQEQKEGKGYTEGTGGFTMYSDKCGMDGEHKEHNVKNDKLTEYDEFNNVKGANINALFDLLRRSEARRASPKYKRKHDWSDDVKGLIGNTLYYKFKKRYGPDVAERFKHDFPQFFKTTDAITGEETEIKSKYWDRWVELGFMRDHSKER
jgi:hypothetical protein